MDYDSPRAPITRAEDAAHWRRWRRNAVVGYVVLLVGFAAGGAIQAKSSADARRDTNDAAKQLCKRLNRTSAAVAAALGQQKNAAIAGLAPADCEIPAIQ